MGTITGIMAWQARVTAVDAVQREMSAALASADQSLQLVFESTRQRGQALIPVIQRELGASPVLDGGTVDMDERAGVPILVVGDNIINGDVDMLQRINDHTGAESEIVVRLGDAWIRAATLLRDAQGNARLGSAIESGSLLAQTLESGKPFSGVVQRDGKWYATSIEPLKDESGEVYGGLSARIDVHDEVDRLLKWIVGVQVANHGTLGILRRSSDGQDWVRVASAEGKAGERLGAGMPAADIALLNQLYSQPGGFAEVALGENGEPQFLAWQPVKNWNWLMYGVGESDRFLQDSSENLRLQMLLMLMGTLLISVLIGWLAAATLRPVRQVIAGMVRLGQGDLTGHIPDVPANSKNEVHTLLDNLKRTQVDLERTVATVRSNVDEISVGSREIAAGNTDLSGRTEQQAASLQETAASMEELAVTVKQNTDHAHQANQLATEASAVAERGEEAMSGVVNIMQKITASSSKIGEIVGVIDGIAFQTNILALNAAVEAARAGEQGKGFAVVAAEVRSLAQRSAEAAKEIKSLITESLVDVKAGSEQVAGAGATMQELLMSVQRVTDITKEISSASQDQSAGIEQVNVAVSQMDQVTQQNAALVEQAAVAAGSLLDQARSLAEAVAVFKVQTGAEGSARSRTRATCTAARAVALRVPSAI